MNMSSKEDLQDELYQLGYQISPFTSKETLANIQRLHYRALTDKNIHVARLNDLELRKTLIKHGFLVGPVTNQTRSIYQRKLLEVLTHETTQGYDSDEPINDENQIDPDLFERKRHSYGLSNQYDEPLTIRNDYKATKSTRSTYSDRKFDDDDSNGVRSRIPPTPSKVRDTPKQQTAKNSSGSFVYIGITVIVALIVFVFNFLLEK